MRRKKRWLSLMMASVLALSNAASMPNVQAASEQEESLEESLTAVSETEEITEIPEEAQAPETENPEENETPEVDEAETSETEDIDEVPEEEGAEAAEESDTEETEEADGTEEIQLPESENTEEPDASEAEDAGKEAQPEAPESAEEPDAAPGETVEAVTELPEEPELILETEEEPEETEEAVLQAENQIELEGAGEAIYTLNLSSLDDFDQYAGPNRGEWSAEDGVLRVDGGNGNKIIVKDQEFTDFVYEADITVEKQADLNDKSSSQGGIVFRASRAEGGVSDGYYGYYFCIDAVGQKVTLGKSSGNNWTEIATKKMTIKYGKSYHVAVAVSGNHITCYVDYNGENYAKLDVVDSTHASGSVGMRNWLSHVSYENAVVREYTEESLSEEESYTNPLLNMCADPDVLYYNGTYYLYPTNAGDANDDQGIKVYTSTDLVHWTDKGFAFKKGDGWGTGNFWAPDIIERDGIFYMYYVANEELCVATSDSPLGPFTQDVKEPMHSNIKEIDAHAFYDEASGKYYLYFIRFTNGNVIYGAELNDDMKSIKEDTVTKIMEADQGWDQDMGNINEGPFMLVKDGKYYLTYSGSHFESINYGSGYAVADSPLGPYTKYENNPIMQSNSLAHGTGHHCITTSPDGTELFMVYHSHHDLNSTEPRQLCIDRLQFTTDEDGNTVLEVKGPTVTPQELPSGAVNANNFIEFDKEDVSDITVKPGTSAEELNLPAQIGVVTSRSEPGASYTVSVTWDTSDYDPADKTEREVVIKGTIDGLPEEIVNLGNADLTPAITVVVSNQEPEEEVFPIMEKIEAEDAVLTSPAKAVARGEASGGYKVGYIDNTSAKVTFTLNAPEDGVYRIEVAADGDTASYPNPSHRYWINGDEENAQIVYYEKATVWDSWSVYALEAELKAGENTLTFSHSGLDNSFAELDYIIYYTAYPEDLVITLDGSKLDGFDQEILNYDVDVESLADLPEVSAEFTNVIGTEGDFELEVVQGTQNRPEAYVRLTSESCPDMNKTYTIRFYGSNTIQNPLVNYGADPYVTYQDGYYYYIRVHKDKELYVSKSAELGRIGQAEPVKIYEPSGDEPNQELWAPEIHFVDGKWYVYYTAGSGSNHRMYVLESDTDDAQGSYTFKGKMAPTTDKWAIDQTILEVDGQLYAVWSGWHYDYDIDQRIYIAKMDSPTSITGERVQLSMPEYTWEKQGGNPTVNEGPQIAVSPDGTVNIVYSASGSWSDDYCLGCLTLKDGADPMDPDSWIKAEEPIFKKNGNTTYSTGHACFTVSPDGTEDYLIYHATKNSGDGWNGRGVRVQRVYWNEDGTPYIGTAIEYNGKVNQPSGTVEADYVRYEAEDAALSGNLSVQETYNSSNGKKVTGFASEEDQAVFTVKVEEAGDYSLFLGAAASADGAGLTVKVNDGEVLEKQVVNFNANAANNICADNWAGYEVKVTLAEGENTLTVSSNAELNAADLDYIELLIPAEEEPTEPEEPDEPEKPVEPGTPVEPTEPEKPTEPTVPVTPEEPSAPEIGSVHTISKLQYRILSADTAAVHKLTDKTVKNAAIPDTVKIDGVTFKVTTIGTQAFKGCTKLETITLGEKITMIGSEAFSGCTALKRVKNASSVTLINKKAFYNCKKLTTVGNKIGTVTLSKVKSIGNNAFYGCASIKKVNASSTALTLINTKAFYKCTSMTTFTAASKKLATIGTQSFYGCKKLATVTLKTEKLTKGKVGANAFKGIKSTCKFKVPSKKVTSYKTILKARGAGSKIKVTK